MRMRSFARIQIRASTRGLFDALGMIIEPRVEGKRQAPGPFDELFESLTFGGKVKKAKTFYIEVGKGIPRTKKTLPLRHVRYHGWIRVVDSRSGQVTATVYGSWEILGAFVEFISRWFSAILVSVTVTYSSVKA